MSLKSEKIYIIFKKPSDDVPADKQNVYFSENIVYICMCMYYLWSP